jgi:hypothetical protein
MAFDPIEDLQVSPRRGVRRSPPSTALCGRAPRAKRADGRPRIVR